jgi:cobalt-zinc-cadmium efflux system protein
VLGAVLAANAALLVAELVGGVRFRSLALLGDAAHLLTDVAGLAVAALALRLVERPATPRHSFGLQRVEVLAAQANGLLLGAASVWLLVEAGRRLAHPLPVAGLGLSVLALVGLVVNGASAALIAGVQGSSLNMRGALLHMLSDAAGSAGALVAGVLAVGWGLDRADPAVSVGIAVLVLRAAWRLLRETTHVLLEGAPRGIDPRAVEEALRSSEGVEGVHHLHLWNLASDVPALSAHVVLRGEVSMHEAQGRGERLKDMLARRFGILHSTLELECHECGPGHDGSGHPPGTPPGRG